MKQNPRLSAIAAALVAMGAVGPAIASNYSVGGPNQTFFYISNWGKNSHTITRMP
jgi:hypothetical protein